jgi:PAS domain S-box-containing protein
MDKKSLLKLRKLVEAALEKGTPDGHSKLEAALAMMSKKAERKRAEEDLRQAEARYRIVADNTYDWEFWMSPQGRLIYISPSCDRVTGHAVDEFESDPDLMMKIIHPDDRAKFSAHSHDSLTKQLAGQITFRVIRPDGTETWVEHFCQPVFDAGGKFLGTRGSNRDITLRRHVEDELIRYRERLEELVYERTAELEKTKKQIELILHTAGEGIFGIDDRGRVTFVNHAAAQMGGWDESDLIGEIHHSLFHHTRPDGSPYPVEECPIYATGRNGTSHRSSGEVFWRKDGTGFPAEYVTTPIFEKKRPVGAVVVFNDITERMRTEKQVRRSVELAKILLDLHTEAPRLTDTELFDFFLEKAVSITASAIGFFHRVAEDQNTIILTTWNSEALKGCTAVHDSHYSIDLAGNWVDCVHLKRPVFYNDFPKSPNQKGLPEGHAPLRRFLSVPLIKQDRVLFIFGVGNKAVDYDEQDVNELQLVANELHKILMQRGAEDALRQSEEKYRIIMDNLYDIIYVFNRYGTFTYVSPSVRHYGYEQADMLGHNIIEFVHPDDHDLVLDAFRRALEQGVELTVDYRMIRKDGVTIWGSAAFRIMRDPAGITQIVGILRDISERKRAEEALRVSEEQLRQRNELFERDLKIARRINLELLPDQPPASGPFKIDFRFLPLDAIGGDFFSFTQIGPDDMAVFIGDVAGHGVPAALFLALLKAATDRNFRKHGANPSDFVTKLNRDLIGAMPSVFLTAIYGIFRAGAAGAPASFNFSKGAHPLPILYRASSGTYEMLESGGTILGMIEDVEFEEKTVPLQKGDRVFLYTDGIPETKNESGAILEFDELPALMKRAHRKELSDMLYAIIDEVNRFRGKAPVIDDVVLIGFEVA